MALRVGWAHTVLTRISRPLTLNNMVSMVAWATAEGGGVGEENKAHYNPLNTTQVCGGSYSINSVGVQSYANEADGLAATVETLGYPAYKGVLGALAAGAPPPAMAYAIGASPWGKPGDLVTSCIYEAAVAVVAYWSPPTTEDNMFIKEPNGAVYWFIAAGAQSYWRPVPTKAAALLPVTPIADDGTWLALWKVGAA